MSMYVWRVKTEYIDAPKEPVRDFLDALIMEGFHDTWGGVVESNAFFEAFEEDLEEKAREYAWEQGLSREDGD